MREFKDPVKFPEGGEIGRCYYSFKIEPYGCGCPHDCLYCYAKSALTFRGLWDATDPRVTDVSKIEAMFEDAFAGKPGRYNRWLQLRIPARLGGMTDPLGGNEARHRVTLRLLRLFNRYRYPYLLITKNARVTRYLGELDPSLAYVQMTVTTLSHEKARQMEPGASPPRERLAAVETMAQAGIKTAVRINPLFPIYSDGYFSRGMPSPERLDYFTWDLPILAAKAAPWAIIVGFVRLTPYNLTWIAQRAQMDLNWLFTHKTNGIGYFSTEEKRIYYETIARDVRALGVRFSICYDRDEDYQAFQYLWEDPNDCCDASAALAAFKTYRRMPRLLKSNIDKKGKSY